LYGQGAAVVTGGQAVIPSRLVKEGFLFNYQYLDKALEDIVN
jgi:NAD dependent epimerase/dehydratase family enzyme